MNEAQSLTVLPSTRPRPKAMKRVGADECPGHPSREREHYSTMVRRLNYLSLASKAVGGGHSYFRSEFRAITHLLGRAVGDDVVSRWLEARGIEVPA